MAKNLTNISLAGGGATKQSATNGGLQNLNGITNFGTLYGLSSENSTPVRTNQDAINNAVSASQQAIAQANAKAAQEAAAKAAAEAAAKSIARTAAQVAQNVSNTVNTSNTSAQNDYGYVTGDSDYQSLLNALYAQQQANAQALNAQQQQNALDTYNRNMAAMNEAYNTRLGLLGGNYDTTMGLLDSNYAQAQAQQRQSAEDALRQAYIDRMMGEKNLTQQLVANGISGGASESARAGLINSYGNSRNAIQRGLMDNLAGLEGNYLTNAHNARQAYNDALANTAAEQASYKAQFSSDLANGNATSYSDYFNQMANLDNTYLSRMGDILANNQSYAQKLALADAEAQAANQQAITSDWRVGYVQDAIKRNLSQQGVLQYLENTGATPEEIAEIMNKAGVTLE